MTDPNQPTEQADATDPLPWTAESWHWDRSAAKENEADEPEATEATG